ncbi:cytochrome P450 [Thermaurantiacus sp.]
MSGRLGAALDGLLALARLVLGARGGMRARLRAVLGVPEGQRAAMAVLRFAKPHLALKSNLVACYEGEGTLLLTRAADVREVLAREAEFAVVYGPRMRALTGGRDFFLGLQDGELYRRDTEALAAITDPDDLARVLALARREAAAAVEAASSAEGEGAIDLPPALAARIPALMVQQWFGVTGGLSLEQLVADATALFHYLFSDLRAEPEVSTKAMAAAARVNAAIEKSRATAAPDTLLARACARGAAGDPAFDADGVRTQMLGLIIGAIPTLSKASCLAIEELLQRPGAIKGAERAARAGDEPRVGEYLFEALRFSPVNPIIYRRAVADTTIGATRVPKGRMVLAANLSAMHDGEVVDAPDQFRPGRPFEQYLLWGMGVHRCWGDQVNRAILPAMLLPLLAKPGLRQVSPPDGAGTPFPCHYWLAWGLRSST